MIKKSEKPLSKTNPHLHVARERQRQFVTAVVTSTSIEGVSITSAQLRKPLKQPTVKK